MPVNIQKYWKGLAVFAAALLLFLPCFQGMAQGAETMDPSRETSLTVYFGHEGTGFSGVEFQLYRMAEMSDTGAFSLTGSFAGYPVSLKGLDSSGWRVLAQTLDAYIAWDGLSPERTALTGGDDLASFSGLSTGLYLVTGNRYEQGRYTYTPESFLVSLPGLSPEGEWNYTQAVAGKYGSTYDPPGGGLPPMEYIQEELVPMAMLPQTGVLWWPVPFLACGGLFLFLIGWGRGRHEESER